MDEISGAQYAVQIAVNTLKDRCHNLQERVSKLEQENLKLMLQSNKNEYKENSLTEVEQLREQVFKLSEQKKQLQDRIFMVTNENQELWDRLGKLSRLNYNTDYQTNKHYESKLKLPGTNELKALESSFKEDSIEAKLDTISLGLMNSFSAEKMESDSICPDMMQMQNEAFIEDSFGFCYDNELSVNILEEFKTVLENLKDTKDIVVSQKYELERLISVFKVKVESLEHSTKKETSTKSTSTLNTEGIEKQTETLPIPKDINENICPMCNLVFHSDSSFETFQNHVEDHFLSKDFNVYGSENTAL